MSQDNARLEFMDKLFVTTRMNDDGTSDGSICQEVYPGHVYCIAKAPKFVSPETWKYNADLIVKCLQMATPTITEEIDKTNKSRIFIKSDGELFGARPRRYSLVFDVLTDKLQYIYENGDIEDASHWTMEEFEANVKEGIWLEKK